jgi:hypothetical protein
MLSGVGYSSHCWPNSLVQSDRSITKIGETAEPQRAVIEAIQKPRMPTGLPFRFEAIAEPAHLV